MKVNWVYQVPENLPSPLNCNGSSLLSPELSVRCDWKLAFSGLY